MIVFCVACHCFFSIQRARAHLGLHGEIKRLTRLLQKSPRDVDLWLRRAELYRRHGEMEFAEADLRRAEVLSPHHPRLGLSWGRLWFSMKRWEKAEVALLRVQQQASPSWEVFWLRARLLRRKSRWDGAYRLYLSSLKRRKRPEIYLETGSLLEARGRSREAERLYREGLKVLGGAVTLRLALLRVLRRQRRYAEAIQVIEQAMKKLPVRFEWWMRRAALLDLEGKTALARLDRFRALQEARGLLRMRASSLNRGREVEALFALGRKQEALECLKRWLRDAPKDVGALRWWRELHKKR